MYDSKKINEEIEAIVKAVLDRKQAALEKNYELLKSLPKQELMYWNMVSQLDASQRKSIDRRLYKEAEIKGLNGIRLIDMLHLAYENYLDQQKNLGDKGNIGNNAAAAAIDLEKRTEKHQAPGFGAGETGISYRDPNTGIIVSKKTGLAEGFRKAAEARLAEFFGEA